MVNLLCNVLVHKFRRKAQDHCSVILHKCHIHTARTYRDLSLSYITNLVIVIVYVGMLIYYLCLIVLS